MQFRTLGKSGLKVSAVSFGAGPISGLMVGQDPSLQQATVDRALQARINWFDTAATYGNGESETSLATALGSTSSTSDVHLATKVRLAPEQLHDIPQAVQQSFGQSLRRLGAQRVTLLQLHNSITEKRGDLPTSITVEDVLGENGVVVAFERLRSDGLVSDFGFTGLGDTRSLDEIVTSGVFTSAQVPLNVLSPLAGQDQAAGSVDVDYERLVQQCATHQVGVIAIRVFAGGALVGQSPSPHTSKTKFFTLGLFQRDQVRAQWLSDLLPDGLSLSEASVRYVLSHPGVTTALIGFANPMQIQQAVAFAEEGPMAADLWQRILAAKRPQFDD